MIKEGMSLEGAAAVKGLLVLLLILTIGGHVSCEPARCGSALNDDDVGSTAVCGENSECENDARCQCGAEYFSISGNHTDCWSRKDPDPRCSAFDDDCVFCGPTFSGPCQRCVSVVYNDQCLNSCPAGTTVVVTNLGDGISANICEGDSTSVLPEWAIIVIIVLGVVVLIIFGIMIIALSCAFLRRSSVGQLDIAERTEKYGSEEVDSRGVAGSIDNPNLKDGGGVMEDYFESDVGKLTEEETEEFFSKLSVLRTESETFLKMLNDMRKRLKELPPTSASTQQYKDVMRDLTRLLYILNKKPELVRIPPDGIQLLDWSEQILNRYLTAQGKPTVNIRAPNTAASNPNRISVIGDQTTTRF